MAEPKAIRLQWPSSIEDVPTYYSNVLMISHGGPEFFLVFGEFAPTPPGIEPPDVINIRPTLKIAVTPAAMVSMARIIQGNVEAYLAKIEQQAEEA